MSRPGRAPAETGEELSIAETIGLVSDAVAIFDRESRLVSVNSRFRETYRAVSAFLETGTSWPILLLEIERRGLLPGQVCDRLRLNESELLNRGLAAEPIELRGPGGASRIGMTSISTGGYAWVESATVDREGQAERQRETDLLMAKVLEACPASLTMFRIGDGQILYRTPAATELLGSARNTNEHFADRIERADFVTALLSSARVDDMRMQGRRADGRPFPASVSARVIDYRGEDVVVATIMDLTDDLEMQDELARQKDLTFQSEKMSALGELLAGVAHELNNPLSIVVGNAMILKEEIRDDRRAMRIEKLANAAERCVGIVRTFLAMARENPLELAPIDIAGLIGTARDTFLAGASDAPLDLTFDVAARLPSVLADEVQVVQVLVNLMTNAQQALAETGRHGLVSVSARLGKTRDRVVISVRDDGPGVPLDLRTRIFDPLFTTKTGGRGTGMGLALCRRILLAHGGSIRLLDSAGPGAEFELEIPVAEAPERRS